MEKNKKIKNLEKISRLFTLVFEALSEYSRERIYLRDTLVVTLPFLGDVSGKSLDCLFQTFWDFFSSSKREQVLVSLEGNGEKSLFLLTVENNCLENFSPYQRLAGVPENITHHIVINLDKLALQIESGIGYLLFSFLRGNTFITCDGEDFKVSLLHNWEITPKGWEKIVTWVFPYGGLGIVIQSRFGLIPIILRGGRKPGGKIFPCWPADSDVSEVTKHFRCQEKLSLAISLKASSLASLVRGNKRGLDLLSNYGKDWLFSIPLELDDLFQDQIAEFLPKKNLWSRYNWTRSSFYKLFQQYKQNTLAYLDKKPIYILFQDHQQKMLLEINSRKIQEIREDKTIPSKSLFHIPVDRVSTVLSWLNGPSLNLLEKFLEAIIPREFSEDVEQREVLLELKVVDELGKSKKLFLSGVERVAPKSNWKGDFSLILCEGMTPCYQVVNEDSPVVVLAEKEGYLVYFPNTDLFSSPPLFFVAKQDYLYPRGLRKIISETSVFAPLVPGLVNKIKLGFLDSREELKIAGRKYYVESGTVIFSEQKGRTLEKGFSLRHMTHTWVGEEKGGCFTGGGVLQKTSLYSELPELISRQERGGIILEQKQVTEISEKNCAFPELFLKGSIQIVGNFSRVGIEQKNVFLPIKFIVLQSWAVPFDQEGNFTLRLRCLFELGKEKGFAVLELPCILPRFFDLNAPVPVQSRKNRHGHVFFYVQDSLILAIKMKNYICLSKKRESSPTSWLKIKKWWKGST